MEDASDDTVEPAAAAATVPLFTDDDSAEPEPTWNVTDDVVDDVFATSLRGNDNNNVVIVDVITIVYCSVSEKKRANYCDDNFVKS